MDGNPKGAAVQEHKKYTVSKTSLVGSARVLTLCRPGIEPFDISVEERQIAQGTTFSVKRHNPHTRKKGQFTVHFKNNSPHTVVFTPNSDQEDPTWERREWNLKYRKHLASRTRR